MRRVYVFTVRRAPDRRRQVTGNYRAADYRGVPILDGSSHPCTVSPPRCFLPSPVFSSSLSRSGAHPWWWRSLPFVSSSPQYFHPWKCPRPCALRCRVGRACGSALDPGCPTDATTQSAGTGTFPRVEILGGRRDEGERAPPPRVDARTGERGGSDERRDRASQRRYRARV